MTVRLLRVGTGEYSQVRLTIPIKFVFLPVHCPAPLQELDLRGSNNAKTTKREYESPNRDAWLSVLRPLVTTLSTTSSAAGCPGKIGFRVAWNLDDPGERKLAPMTFLMSTPAGASRPSRRTTCG
jgi:hypothetical protein